MYATWHSKVDRRVVVVHLNKLVQKDWNNFRVLHYGHIASNIARCKLIMLWGGLDLLKPLKVRIPMCTDSVQQVTGQFILRSVVTY